MIHPAPQRHVEHRSDPTALSSRLRLTVAVWPLRVDDDERVAEGCREGVGGTGEGVGSRLTISGV